MSHWLSYTHSDQSLLRDPSLARCWNALVVPGTLATFYFEGTGGFVLAQRAPYVIDPRTPLLQTIALKRPDPRASHLKLLEIHDEAAVEFWPRQEISIAHWQDGRWPAVVRRVIDFQLNYSTTATAKLSKYERLKAEARGEPVEQDQATDDPLALVPPYWAVRDRADPWWSLSRDAIELSASRHPGRIRPILAADATAPIRMFVDLLDDLPSTVSDVFCWRGSWDEASATIVDVEGWITLVREARARGIEVTNLYGGYLSVLLTALGLGGVSHGIGYSESRDVRRLGETGAPPTRYYVPAVHGFLPVPAAQPLVDHLPPLWACGCAVCEGVAEDGRPLIDRLSPEQRKRQFLLARAAELANTAQDVHREVGRMREVASWLENHPLPQAGTARFTRILRTWADAVSPHLPQ